MFKINNLLYFILFLLLAGCSDNFPEGVLQPIQMRKVFWQMSIADQLIASDTNKAVRMHLKDSTVILYQRILKDNNVTQSVYNKSLKYYQSKPALMKLLVDTTVNYGKNISDSFEKHYKPKLKTDKDSSKKTISAKLEIKQTNLSKPLQIKKLKDSMMKLKHRKQPSAPLLKK